MSHPACYVAVDLGAESGRVILGRFDGERIELQQVHRLLNGPVRLPDGLHWDVLRLWDECKHGIAQAGRTQGTPIASVGIDTWGVDFGLLDRDGALLSNPHHYRDHRTTGMLDEAFRRMPRERIFDLTGIQFMPINTLYQLLSMAMNRSPLLAAADTLLTMPDLFNYWLSGQKVSEFTIATTTQCYDPRARTWSEPLLNAMGIPRTLFPAVVPPGTVLGPLLPEVARELDVQVGALIAPACHDTGSAVAAVPATVRDFAWISSGTWSILGTESSLPVIDAASLDANFTNEGGVNQTFRLCKNITGLWLVQECRRAWAAQGSQYSYDQLAQMAGEAPPLVSLIDADDPVFAEPGDMPARIRAYCQRTGQPVPEGPAAVTRCALEGNAIKYRRVLSRLEEIIGHRLNALHIVGGGTKNRLLNQLAADATGRPVIAGPAESTALGNILVQAIALGHIGSLSQGREVVRRSCELETFEPRNTAAWDEADARFDELVKAQGRVILGQGPRMGTDDD